MLTIYDNARAFFWLTQEVIFLMQSVCKSLLNCSPKFAWGIGTNRPLVTNKIFSSLLFPLWNRFMANILVKFGRLLNFLIFANIKLDFFLPQSLRLSWESVRDTVNTLLFAGWRRLSSSGDSSFWLLLLLGLFNLLYSKNGKTKVNCFDGHQNCILKMLLSFKQNDWKFSKILLLLLLRCLWKGINLAWNCSFFSADKTINGLQIYIASGRVCL